MSSLENSSNKSKLQLQKVKNRFNLYDIMCFVLVGLISAFLIVVPFYRGLYFRENYIPAITYMSITFLLYILYKMIKKENDIIKTYLDIVILSLPFVYLLSFFFSVNARDAFDSVLKYSSYFMIYKIVSDVCINNRIKRVVENVILVSIFILAATGLLTYFGYIKLNGVFVGNRFYGLYQYTNATASVLAAGIFMAFGLMMKCNNMVERFAYQVILSTIFPMFVVTLSRGAYLVFALVFVIYLLIVDARKRFYLVYSLLALVITNAPFLWLYFGGDKSYKEGMLYVFAVIAFAILELIYNKILQKFIDKISKKSISVFLLIVILIAAGATYILFAAKVPIEYKIEHAANEEKSWKNKGLTIEDVVPNTNYNIEFYTKSNFKSPYSYGVAIDAVNASGARTNIFKQFGQVDNQYKLLNFKFDSLDDTKSIIIILYNYENNSYTTYKDIRLIDENGKLIKEFSNFKYLPEQLGNRLLNINFQTENAQLRGYFLKDGIKIFKDYFLIGAGGGGWQNLYRKYQSFTYNSTEAHNFYLQVMIETGILGIVVLLLFCLIVLNKMYISIFKLKELSDLSLYLALLMIIGHAFFDFDLSLSAFAFLFWSIVGIVSASMKGMNGGIPKSNYIRLAALLFGLVALFYSSSIYFGMNDGKKAANLIKKDINRSVSLYETAMKSDRYNVNYYLDYIQVLSSLYINDHNPDRLAKINSSIEKIMSLETYNLQHSQVVIKVLVGLGQIDKAITVANKVEAMNPMLPEAYMLKLQVNYEVAKYYFSTTQHEKAIPYLNNMIESKREFEISNARALKPLKEPENFEKMVGLAENWLGIAQKRIKE